MLRLGPNRIRFSGKPVPLKHESGGDAERPRFRNRSEKDLTLRSFGPNCDADRFGFAAKPGDFLLQATLAFGLV